MQDYRMATFLTLCRTLNFTRAAEQLHISQPAVSQHIQYLESYYGVQLFAHIGKTLIITNAGRLLQNTTTTMQHDEVILKEQMRCDKRQLMNFGATRTIGDFLMPEKLAHYITAHPETDVIMIVDNTETLLQKINDGELDFALIEGYFHKTEYDYRDYSREHYIAVCGKHYFIPYNPRTVSDLFEERIILREKGSGTREVLHRYLEERNCHIHDFSRRIEIGSISAIKSLLCAGCGISFLYELSVRAELDSGALRQIPLIDFEVYHDFSLVWRKNSAFQNRYIDIFEDLLHQP